MKKSKSRFNPLKPFQDAPCYAAFLKAFQTWSFKLYGRLNFTIIAKTDFEFDLNAGEVHYTEKDLKGISRRIESLNRKWNTKITYCLFPSNKYPANILINVRSPKAPFALSDEE